IIASVASYGLINLSRTARVAPTNYRRGSALMAFPIRTPRLEELRDLVDHSPEIVIGVPVAKRTQRSSTADRMVFTDFEVQVLQTLKGDRHKGRIVTLRVPGGSALLDNGSAAEITVPAFCKNPEIGKAYVFF